MLKNYTAKYTKIDSGYLGQLVEWPAVVTEGRDIEDCRVMLRDALAEMIAAYQESGAELPCESGLLEQIAVEVDDVGQAS